MVLALLLAGALAGAELTSLQLTHFLLWTTLGNAIGGILFAASVQYSLRPRNRGNRATT